MLPSLQTLFLPLDRGDVPAGDSAVFFHADWHPALRTLPPLTCAQPFRPAAARLEAAGMDGLHDIQAVPDRDLAIVHVPKQVQEAQFALACALLSLRPGGWLLAGAANDANGARLEKWFGEAGLEASSLSKNKARAVWAKRPEILPGIVQGWYAAGSRRNADFGGGIEFMTQPGVFSWDRLDAGTALLLDHIPALKGTGADFGSGIGLLSRGVLSRNAMTDWHLVEADSRALACAGPNLADVQGACAVKAHWADLTAPVPGLPPLDVVVMNPPFHTGKFTDAALGQSFLQTAHHHLKKGGRLYMVANAHLPYEAVLSRLYASVRPLAQDHGFKILEAVK